MQQVGTFDSSTNATWKQKKSSLIVKIVAPRCSVRSVGLRQIYDWVLWTHGGFQELETPSFILGMDGQTICSERLELNCSSQSKVGNSNPSGNDSVGIRANLSGYCCKLCLQCFRRWMFLPGWDDLLRERKLEIKSYVLSLISLRARIILEILQMRNNTG